MLPLYDLLARASDGRAVELMARQYNLSRQQAQLAAKALLPAFSEGLKQNASDPLGITTLMTNMAGGRHARYFDDAGRAFSAEGVSEGNDILSQLFGSREMSSAIATQAAQATGIAQETLKAMLPSMAAMIMGGLHKQANGEISGSGTTQPDNPFLMAIQEMMRAGIAPPTPRPTHKTQSSTSPFDNPFTRMVQEMVEASRPKTEPEKPVNPSGRPRNTYDDLFGQMFETGRKTRSEYEEAMAEIFERFARKPPGT